MTKHGLEKQAVTPKFDMIQLSNESLGLCEISLGDKFPPWMGPFPSPSMRFLGDFPFLWGSLF